MPPQPLGSYTPVSDAGNLLFVSGQVPLAEGKMSYAGRVRDTLSVEGHVSCADGFYDQAAWSTAHPISSRPCRPTPLS